MHATEYSNASRTMLYDIHTRALGRRPAARRCAFRARCCRTVRESSGTFGETDPEWLGGAIPIAGMAGDQQAALFGQGCFAPGRAKNTYGTGCFLLMNTGREAPLSKTGLLTTIAWGLGGAGRVRARGQRLRRGRGGAVAARRAGADRERGRERSRCALGARHRRRLSRAGLRRPRRALLGRARARHDRRPHARHHARTRDPRHARSRSRTRRATWSSAWPATPASRSKCCASTAARAATTS